MSQTTDLPQGTPATGQGQPTPPLVVNIQYVKDLSFEVPGAPLIYTTLRSAPRVDINLDVQVRRLQDGQNVPSRSRWRSVPRRTRRSTGNGSTEAGARVFLAELAYAGIFTLTNVPDNAVEPMLLVECPRLLFPFARKILADVTRDGGFPPVLLQPIDFVALWQSRRAQAAAQAGASVGAAVA